MNDFMEDFMEKIEPLKLGKYTFLTSLAIGTYLFAGFVLTKNDAFAICGYLYLVVAIFANFLIFMLLFFYGIAVEEKRRECFIGSGLILLNIPIAALYFWILEHIWLFNF
jgi:LIVCS family branched-chain amino acid:cation transporter